MSPQEGKLLRYVAREQDRIAATSLKLH